MWYVVYWVKINIMWLIFNYLSYRKIKMYYLFDLRDLKGNCLFDIILLILDINYIILYFWCKRFKR